MPNELFLMNRALELSSKSHFFSK